MVSIPKSMLMVGLLVLAMTVAAQGTSGDEAIPLQDGGRVVVRADGSMGHYGPTGAPVAMAEGEVMVARDGTRLLMKAETLWRQVLETAATYYALASVPSWLHTEGDDRWIELADGGRVKVRRDGTMTHLDAAGRGVSMPDGVAMTAKDGTRLMMKNGALWSPMMKWQSPPSRR